MVMCSVPLCPHYSQRETCKFFRFPRNISDRQSWINLIRPTTEPKEYARVCSCHFEHGDRKNLPTLCGGQKKKFDFPTPEKRKHIEKSPLTHDRKEAATVSVRKLTAAFKGAHLQGDARTEELAQPLEDVTQVTEPSPGPSGRQSPTVLTPITEASDSQSHSRSVSRLSTASLEAENYLLQKENQDLKEKVEKLSKLKGRFCYDSIKGKDEYTLMYTGIPSSALFEILYAFMDKFKLNYYAQWKVEKINKIDQLLMILMKLKLNVPFGDLTLRFGVSYGTVSNVVHTWLYALHEVLFSQLMKDIPSRKRNAACLPSCFYTFSTCRIILDCTEMQSAVPKNLEKQRLTYSSYKHRNTWKVLVGVAPNGVITYVSQAYPGSTSHQKIVQHCGILEKMNPGDIILADKGFLIKDLLPPGVSLNIPPFLTTGQFTEEQVYETQRIARARIHVERAIRRLKCYHILDRIPQYFIPHISVLVQTCAALTNFQYPLIKEVEAYYS